MPGGGLDKHRLMHACMQTYTHKCMHTDAHACMHALTHTHARTHTYTHTTEFQEIRHKQLAQA